MRYFLFLGLILFSSALFGQSKEELERQRDALKREISVANELLQETATSRQATVTELQTLSKKIQTRERLIRTINRQLANIDRDIAAKAREIVALEHSIDSLKNNYADLIRLAHRQRQPKEQVLFILSAESFAQAAKRLQYLKDMTAYRQRQVEGIVLAQEELKREQAALEAQKEQKRALQREQEAEVAALETDAAQQVAAVDELKTKESELKQNIANKQRMAKQLEDRIKVIIAAELERARLQAERQELLEEATSLGLVKGTDYTDRTSNTALKTLIKTTRDARGMEERDEGAGFVMTPEARALANNFAANMGALPWPVERGMITGDFGKHPHPVVRGVIVDNPHVEISTAQGSAVRVVFEGEVSSVVPIPGANTMVLVRHGNYFTVYSNLIDVVVKSGDKLKIKDRIGTAFTDEEGKTMVQFGLWKDADIQNPAPWLAH